MIAGLFPAAELSSLTTPSEAKRHNYELILRICSILQPENAINDSSLLSMAVIIT